MGPSPFQTHYILHSSTHTICFSFICAAWWSCSHYHLQLCSRKYCRCHLKTEPTSNFLHRWWLVHTHLVFLPEVAGTNTPDIIGEIHFLFLRYRRIRQCCRDYTPSRPLLSTLCSPLYRWMKTALSSEHQYQVIWVDHFHTGCSYLRPLSPYRALVLVFSYFFSHFFPSFRWKLNFRNNAYILARCLNDGLVRLRGFASSWISPFSTSRTLLTLNSSPSLLIRVKKYNIIWYLSVLNCKKSSLFGE